MKSICKILILCLFPFTAGAQTLLHQKINPDPSSIQGLTILQDTPSYASFGNIAALAFERQSFSVSAGDLIWLSSNGDLHIFNTSASMKIAGPWSISLGGAYMLNYTYESLDINGNPTGKYRPYDWMFNVGTSYRITDFLSAGINMSYANSALAKTETYNASAADIFLMGKYSDFLASVGVTDVGFAWHEGEYKYDLPSAVTLAVSYEKLFRVRHKMSVSADTNISFIGRTALSCALLYSYNDIITTHIAYRYGSQTFLNSCYAVGVSVCLKKFSLGTSLQKYLNNNYLKGSISFSLSFKV